ncbi:MAG: hypothetical protein J0H78_18275 [Rhizobiales bacterium]|nr:hypothetical protein [Hyphomicrobiales bacterium]
MSFKHARTLLIATALATGAVSYAAAQSSPAPANQSGGGISATTPAPTDPGTAGQSGNTKGTPAMGAKQMQKTPMTTGSGMKSAPNSRDSKMETMEKTKSPASQNSGLKKEK